MKTIFFVVKAFPKVTETFVVTQIIEAKKAGFKVKLLTYDLLPIENTTQHELLQKHNFFKDIISVDYHIPSSKFRRIVKALYYIIKYFKFWIKIKGESIKNLFFIKPFQIAYYNIFRSVDVFHIQFAIAGLELADMKTIGLITSKFIVTLHGHDVHFKNQIELLKKKSTYQKLFQVTNYTTINTNYLKKKAIEMGCVNDKIITIPMGVDVSFFNDDNAKKAPEKSTIKLISIGRLIEIKGFQFAIQAIKSLVESGFNLNYTIVGEGQMENELHELVNSLELNHAIEFAGRRNQTEIKNLLKENHLFLMCSVTDKTSRAEAQGVVTAEAQAMGLPVVAFNCGGVPYTIQDGKTGFLVKEKDVLAYKDAIISIVNNSENYSNMSKAARELVESEFSNAIMGKKFMKLYLS